MIYSWAKKKEKKKKTQSYESSTYFFGKIEIPLTHFLRPQMNKNSQKGLISKRCRVSADCHQGVSMFIVKHISLVDSYGNLSCATDLVYCIKVTPVDKQPRVIILCRNRGDSFMFHINVFYIFSKVEYRTILSVQK